METKVCSRCGFTCPIESVSQFFTKNRHYPDALSLTCKSCLSTAKKKDLRGEGPAGFLGRMRILYRASCRTAQKRGHHAPSTSPEAMVIAWDTQDGVCAACLQPMEGFRGVDFDHDHLTGHVRGFIHHGCNIVEGVLKTTPKSAILNLVNYILQNNKNL